MSYRNYKSTLYLSEEKKPSEKQNHMFSIMVVFYTYYITVSTISNSIRIDHLK